MTLEAEFAVVLEEMDAEREWARLDRDTQLSWLHWIEHSGPYPRVRMYDTVNHLRDGITEPPRFATAKGWLRAALSLDFWR